MSTYLLAHALRESIVGGMGLGSGDLAQGFQLSGLEINLGLYKGVNVLLRADWSTKMRPASSCDVDTCTMKQRLSSRQRAFLGD